MHKLHNYSNSIYIFLNLKLGTEKLIFILSEFFFHNRNGVRSGKNTHFSRISNSVTHLQSYTNSAITDICYTSPWYSTNITTGSTGITASSANIALLRANVASSSADLVSLNGECSSVSWCFTMFYVLLVDHDVLCVS